MKIESTSNINNPVVTIGETDHNFTYTNNYNFFLFNRVWHLTELLATNMFGQFITTLARNLYGILKSRITDGYWLVFLSPLVLVSWILATITLSVYTVVVVPFIVILPICSIPTLLWAVLFEIPSGFINKKNDLQIKKYKICIDNFINSDDIYGLISIILFGIPMISVIFFFILN
jgi:hypothetical protein